MSFTFRTVRGNTVNWTDHADYPGLVVFEKDGRDWFLLRRKRGESEQRIPLAGVLDRIERQVCWYGRVYLNEATGKASRWASDVRPSYRPAPRVGYSRADAAVDGAVVGTLLGIAIGVAAGSSSKR